MKLSTAKEIMTLNTEAAVKFVRENLNWLNDEEQMFEEATSGNWTDGEYTDEEVDEAIQTVDDNWVREMIENLTAEKEEEEKKMTKKSLNGHEKIAARNIRGAFNWLVGGWYNCIQDGCEEDIPELEEAKETVYEEAMNNLYTGSSEHYGRAPKEMRFAGEEFCRSYVDKLFAEDDDALEIWGEETKEDKKMEKNNEREAARAYILKNYTVKEMREHLKEGGFTGYSRANKETLAEAMLALEDLKNSKKTVQISKVNMFAFTGMFIGEFEAEVQDGKILVNTTSKGELMFNLKTGKEIADKNKSRYANRVEAV